VETLGPGEREERGLLPSVTEGKEGCRKPGRQPERTEQKEGNWGKKEKGNRLSIGAAGVEKRGKKRFIAAAATYRRKSYKWKKRKKREGPEILLAV